MNCEHCGGDLKIRNPMGICDHLYYPEYCEICSKREQERKKKMKTLTADVLEWITPHSIFAQGEIVDSPEGVNMSNSGKMLRWVAVRGGISDWAIYAHFADKSWQEIAEGGDKVFNKENIKKLVPCDESALKAYRY